MKYLLLLILLTIMVMSAGCAFFSLSDTISVTLPDPPDHWIERFSSLSFSIVYYNIHGEETEEILKPGENSCSISVPKVGYCPVVATPICDSFVFPPAGGFYTGGDSLVLTWEQGFAASLLKTCCSQGFDINRFNVERFVDQVEQRSDCDPWNLDAVFIKEKLMEGDFRVTYIRLSDTADISFSIKSGKWFFASPFSPVYELSAPGILSVENISYGFHRLFHVNSPGWYELFITEKETIVVPYMK